MYKIGEHLPSAWVYAGYADLFEYFLGLDSSDAHCTFDQFRDNIETHTGLELSKLTHTAIYSTYEERWVHERYSMLVDTTYGLTIRLGSGESGKDWMDLWNHEHDHLRRLYVKDMGVGQIRGLTKKNRSGSTNVIFRMLLETLKCKVEDVGNHERGSRDNHATKLLYNPQLTYDYSQAKCESGTLSNVVNSHLLFSYTHFDICFIPVLQFLELKEIQSLLVDLESREITTGKGSHDAEPRTSFESLEAIVYFHTRMLLGDVHPGTEDEYKAKRGQRQQFVNQLILYLFKSVSLNPNPRGEKFWDVIPIRKSGIDIHHPVYVKYDVPPAILVTYSTEFMISELKRGRCTALWRADHTVISMFEDGVVDNIPKWMKDISRS